MVSAEFKGGVKILLIMGVPLGLVLAFVMFRPLNYSPSVGPSHGGIMMLARNTSSGNTYPIEVVTEMGVVGPSDSTILTAVRIYFRAGGSVELRDCHFQRLEDLDDMSCYDMNGTMWEFLKFMF